MKQKFFILMLVWLWQHRTWAQFGKGQHYVEGSLTTTFNEAGTSVIYNSNNGYIVYSTGHISLSL